MGQIFAKLLFGVKQNEPGDDFLKTSLEKEQSEHADHT